MGCIQSVNSARILPLKLCSICDKEKNANSFIYVGKLENEICEKCNEEWKMYSTNKKYKR